VLKRGDRIAQLVIQQVSRARFLKGDTLPGSHRGDGGFGSSGGWKANAQQIFPPANSWHVLRKGHETR
jgi:dUTP pyrophosphatase